MSALHIEVAAPCDAAELLAIYTPYVTDTSVTFEYDVPSVEAFRTRIEETLTHYPYLVARLDSRIVGYAYAHAFKTRAAYDWAVETSIYVAQDCHSQGIGKALLLACLNAMKEEGYGYGIIGSAGPVKFYEKTCGATVIEGSDPGVYRGMYLG